MRDLTKTEIDMQAVRKDLANLASRTLSIEAVASEEFAETTRYKMYRMLDRKFIEMPQADLDEYIRQIEVMISERQGESNDILCNIAALKQVRYYLQQFASFGVEIHVCDE